MCAHERLALRAPWRRTAHHTPVNQLWVFPRILTPPCSRFTTTRVVYASASASVSVSVSASVCLLRCLLKAAGVNNGDRIVAVNRTPVANIGHDAVVEMIRAAQDGRLQLLLIYDPLFGTGPTLSPLGLSSPAHLARAQIPIHTWCQMRHLRPCLGAQAAAHIGWVVSGAPLPLRSRQHTPAVC